MKSNIFIRFLKLIYKIPSDVRRKLVLRRLRKQFIKDCITSTSKLTFLKSNENYGDIRKDSIYRNDTSKHGRFLHLNGCFYTYNRFSIISVTDYYKQQYPNLYLELIKDVK